MSLEQNNSAGWRNWGDHPLFVLLSAIGIIIGILFAILSYYKSDNPSTNENASPAANIENLEKSFPKSLNKDLVIGLYVNKGILTSLSNNFSEKMETVVKELKPLKIGVIKFGKDESIWSLTPKDFSFTWNDGYFTSNESARRQAINELVRYIQRRESSSTANYNCTSINDLKTRIAKDNYQYNIIITDFISTCSNHENEISLPSEKKVLVLLMARSSTSDSRTFYYDEETLKKNFQTAKIFPFVSVDEKQIIEFLQTP